MVFNILLTTLGKRFTTADASSLGKKPGLNGGNEMFDHDLSTDNATKNDGGGDGINFAAVSLAPISTGF